MKNANLSRTFVCAVIMTNSLLASYPVFAAINTLGSGDRYVIEPSSTVCKTSSFEKPARPRASTETSCNTNTGKLDVDARTANPLGLKTSGSVSVGADANFEYRFVVMDDPTSIQKSFVTVNVQVEVDWALRLLNGAISSKFGTASLTSFLRLRVSPRDNRTDRGGIIEDVQIVAATHGGNSGCLSVPKTKAAAAKVAVKCAASAFQSLDGAGVVSFTTVVEVGRIYTIELGTNARAQKPFTFVQQAAVQVAGSLVDSAPPALKWDRMIVKIGTDPVTVVSDLQAQIDELMEALGTLEKDFDIHGHDYLTGRGNGHNNSKGTTSGPTFE